LNNIKKMNTNGYFPLVIANTIWLVADFTGKFFLPLKLINECRHGGTSLQTQLLRRQRSEESWFKVRLGKKLAGLYLNL
jgi:hypothetical protein